MDQKLFEEAIKKYYVREVDETSPVGFKFLRKPKCIKRSTVIRRKKLEEYEEKYDPTDLL